MFCGSIKQGENLEMIRSILENIILSMQLEIGNWILYHRDCRMSYLENIYTSSHTSICSINAIQYFNNKALLINTSFNSKLAILGLRSGAKKASFTSV
jgi:hypothetical protein